MSFLLLQQLLIFLRFLYLTPTTCVRQWEIIVAYLHVIHVFLMADNRLVIIR